MNMRITTVEVVQLATNVNFCGRSALRHGFVRCALPPRPEPSADARSTRTGIVRARCRHSGHRSVVSSSIRDRHVPTVRRDRCTRLGDAPVAPLYRDVVAPIATLGSSRQASASDRRKFLVTALAAASKVQPARTRFSPHHPLRRIVPRHRD